MLVKEQSMAYFDNAATTFPKPECVYQEMDSFYRQTGVNVNRGSYSQAESAGKLVQETRCLIQELLHCPDKQVIFTPTATLALNIILQGLINEEITHIYISPFEHNAVTRILHSYGEQIQVHVMGLDKFGQFDLQKTKESFVLTPPDIVIISHVSNVTGRISPVEEIFSLAKKLNPQVITVVDMAQSAGLVDLDTGSEDIDYAVFAGHKTLYGPTGISGFVMNRNQKLKPILFGGTGTESALQSMPESLPQRFEMGTLNISAMAGLNSALRWILSIGTHKLLEKEKENRERLISLVNEYDFVKIVDNYDTETYTGIVSILIEGIGSDTAENLFNRLGIAVRSGLQCAPLAHRTIGTFPAGTIRFSTSYFTNEKDYEELREALDEIEQEY